MEGTGEGARYRAALLERSPACAGATDIGPVRARNEDAYWISPDGSALVVADGLGGLPAGDVASMLAVAAVVEHLALVVESAANDAHATRTRARPPAADELSQWAREAAACAQRTLIKA